MEWPGGVCQEGVLQPYGAALLGFASPRRARKEIRFRPLRWAMGALPTPNELGGTLRFFEKN